MCVPLAILLQSIQHGQFCTKKKNPVKNYTYMNIIPKSGAQRACQLRPRCIGAVRPQTQSQSIPKGENILNNRLSARQQENISCEESLDNTGA
jgi:hypothetical protein